MSFGLPKQRRAAPRGPSTAVVKAGEACEPDWERLAGLVTLEVEGQSELLEVDGELGPLVYTASGQKRHFEFSNLNTGALTVVEIPQKQWKDYTSSERKVACYMAARRNQALRQWASQESQAELIAKQEAVKKEEEAAIKALEGRCQAERERPPIQWQPIAFETVTEHHMKKAPGMLYGLEFPWTGPMLEEFGPNWLTEAFHRAGSLEKSNRVTQVRVENIKVTAGNNAGKFLFNVRYANERPGLHTKLFAKVPFQMTKETKQDRLSSSVLKQPMDFFEINTYRLGETTLPIPTPKFYYGDISNLTSNFILITERVPFVEMDGRKRGRQLKPYEVEGPYDKCKDYQLRGSAKEYYAKIMEVCGKIAGADKSGRMGSQEFLAKSYATPRARLGDLQAWGVTPHAASGGPPQANLGKLNTAIQFFSETAKVVFPSYAADPEFVQKFTTTMMTFMAYINELEYWKHQDPDYVALAHSNLNVDNAYYWRDEAGNLDCGVLDWGGFGSGCLGHKIWWYLNCSEWQPIQEHLGHYVDTFIQSYRASGGPALDRDRLLLMVKLTSLGNLFFMVSAVPDCLRQCPAKEWASIKDRRDPRIDENIGGKSTLRTTLRVMDNGLRMIEELQTDKELERWIQDVWVKQFGNVAKTHEMIFGSGE